jgi:hypothetical protein
VNQTVKVLFIGDIFGQPGRRIVKEMLPALREEFAPDLVLANGENAAAGFGITPALVEELLDLGIAVLTSGNHIWDKKEILPYLAERADGRLLRPANYPRGVPGQGLYLGCTQAGLRYAVLNLQGRVFMPTIDCPFRTADALLPELQRETPIILVDMHAEATSESLAMGWYLDGRVSAVVGTHRHVQTADERVLPGGTAYITDLGLTGPTDGVIGVDRDQIIQRFLHQMPIRFETAKGPASLQGVVITLDPETGRASDIRRLRVPA